PTRHPATESAAENVAYPRHSTPGGGYAIATEVATFDYDEVGNLIGAHNADARVTRAYNVNGTPRSETQRINTLARDDFARHVHEVGYEYDLSGRRVEVRHPEALAPSPTQRSTSYAYDPLTGTLASVTDARGNRFRYGFNVRGELETLHLPGGISERYQYDADGNLSQHDVLNQSTAPYRAAAPYLRGTSFTYDLRGKLRHTRNLHGTRDTLDAWYSGLGQLIRGGTLSYSQPYGTSCTLRRRQAEQFSYDALGNRFESLETDSTRVYSGTSTTDCSMSGVRNARRDWRYESGTGRLALAISQHQRDTTLYDAAGNVEFTTQAWYDPYSASATLKDHASYYSVDGKLRAADSRTVASANVEITPFTAVFEEYRYDALGRRVWVRARRYCEHDPERRNGECNLDLVRRTVWDGGAELYEIQMPGGDDSPYLENDVGIVELPVTTENSGYNVDPNPFYGRVAYTHGLGTDRPLGVIRLGYGDLLNQSGQVVGHRTVVPFGLVPLWSARGQPDLGVFDDGATAKCEGASTTARCVSVGWAGNWFAYARPRLRPMFWHGTLLDDKRDAAGTHYRRNRYYDPSTGRFTQ
ncbi:MAG TPA: hypothetical protein VE913_23810, partial [Longimicrobium sp.]|nr:hypothetical protein [Longimicrobium sp.]